MDSPLYTRKGAGCLILTLAPSILVVGMFFVVGLFMLVFKGFGIRSVDPAYAEPTSWWSILVTLGFSFPILVLLVRALYGAVIYVRTVKSVLNNELVRKYFLRYNTRRVMTPHGVRTAGILLFVRMDDPLTPEDQASYGLEEEEFWYSPEYGDPEEA